MKPELFETVGGTAACRRLSETFYGLVAKDPLLRPLFPGKTFTCAIEEFTAFLVQFLGGPGEDSQRRWWLSLRESHQRFQIGERERAAWIANMVIALREVPLDDGLRSQLHQFFEGASRYVGQPGVAFDPPETEIGQRWRTQMTTDEIVAAIRRGDEVRAVELTDGSALMSRSVRCGVLALLIRSGMTGCVRENLVRDPDLVLRKHAGRTLLHEAAACGSTPMVKLLLDSGADPNALDGGRHTPLYSVGNECLGEGGPEVVRLLVKSGADVNACGGSKRCTALHMAARRGNVEVARALLECGADLHARDSRGATPLQRARNCRKSAVAAFLLSS